MGRAIVIDEKLCNKAEIDLQIAEQKSLVMGFGHRYEQEKEKIHSILRDNPEPNSENTHDLVTYIRNMSLKYGIDALLRIREVGIAIDEELLSATLGSVSGLEIPRIICMNNFYWDPLLLNQIYLDFANGNWPAVPSNVIDSATALRQLITKMYSEARYYYERYLGNIDPDTEYGLKKILSLCIYSENYARGRALKDVINPLNFPIENSDDIDNRINDLHTKVIFGIPKLLKPIFNIHDHLIQSSSSQILSFIEVGAVDSRLRALIEIGIPRETAIALLQSISHINFLDTDGKVNETDLNAFILSAKSSSRLSEWHKLLIQDV